MDANGLRSFGLSLGRGLYPQRAALQADEAQREVTVEGGDGHRIAALRLASRAPAFSLREKPRSVAEIETPPAIAIDPLGNCVVADAKGESLWSLSHLRTEQPELAPMPVAVPQEILPLRDLAFGADDVLYIAGGASAPGILLIDMRARFDPTLAQADPGAQPFRAERIAAHADGGLVVLDMGRKRLARLRGLPLFTRGVDVYRERDDRFEAAEPNPNPLSFEPLPAQFEAGEFPVAIAVADGGAAAVLCAVPGKAARVRLLRPDGRLTAAVTLRGPRFPHAIGWMDDEHLALMADAVAVPDAPGATARDPGAFVYRLEPELRDTLLGGESAGEDALHPLGDYFPLPRRAPGPFAVSPLRPGAQRQGPRLNYPRSGTHLLVEPVPVARISLPTRAPYGAAANFPDGLPAGALRRNTIGSIDSRDPATVWHRLYAEAHVPPGCALVVWLCANDAGPPAFGPDLLRRGPREAWFPHLIGDPAALPPQVAAALPADLPRAVWVKEASEVPLGESLLSCERRANVAGLFTVLIQRAGLVVRALRGRRLWVAVELFGNGRHSPELAALRLYGGRVSYRDRHLPALYREQVAGAEAERPGRASGADFLERFIDLFEGVFTSIEDRVAHAHLFTDAWACPPESLPWLASWIGLALEPGVSPPRARKLLANAPFLARRHGTLEGLTRALDLASDGGVAAGRIVVAENFRLRRTLATILGAQLADFDDPLTAGIAQGAHSVVGDALFLGDENAKTFLALFRTLRADPGASSFAVRQLQDQRDSAIHALFDGLAHRATVLVHDAGPDELLMIERVAALAAPAHVHTRVVAARYPFLVAVASLVGADTYLREPEPVRPVEVDRSRLGYVDTLQGLADLDARNGAFQRALRRPVADAGDDRSTDLGASFTLDGSRSQPAPGHRLTDFTWTWTPPGAPDQPD